MQLGQDEAITIDDEDTAVATYAAVGANPGTAVRTPGGRVIEIFAEGSTEYITFRGYAGEMVARFVVDEHGVLLRVPSQTILLG